MKPLQNQELRRGPHDFPHPSPYPSTQTDLSSFIFHHIDRTPPNTTMDDLEIDPAIAEAMGFTSFGSKRRKHTARADDAFIDDSGNQIAASTGANDVPLGKRPAVSATQEQLQEQGDTNMTTVVATEQEQERDTREEGKAEADDWTPGFPSREELAALRRGVKNARGDMVVFMPSFIEDPWKGLA